MAAIQNLGGVNNNPQKVSSKISFDVGDSFSGKVVAKDESGKEATIRTSDGWQFTAELEGNSTQITDKYSKFQVVGYENGKVKLKVVSTGQESGSDKEDFLENILKQNGLNKSDTAMLQKMVQFSIPLTRDNISKVKSLMDFIVKLKGDGNEAQEFIAKYLDSRGISETSEEGINIKNQLSELFKALNSLELEDILTLEENNIDITPENIKSYNNVVKGDQRVYNVLENLKQNMDMKSSDNNKTQIINDKNIQKMNQDSDDIVKQIFDKLNNNDSEGTVSNDSLTTSTVNSGFTDQISEKEATLNSGKTLVSEIERQEKLFNKLAEVISGVNDENEEQNIQNKSDGVKLTDDKNSNRSLLQVEKDTIKLLLKRNDEFIQRISNTVKQYFDAESKTSIKVDISDNSELQNKLQNLIKNDFVTAKNISNSDLAQIIKIVSEPFGKNIASDTKNLKEQNKNNSSIISDNNVKSEINEKTASVKQIISDLLKKTEDNTNSNINTIVSNLKDNINDLKIFNDLSDKYYYMDMPLKFNETDYPCKLIIKDDRKKGKQIDSTNVKIALSVATVNMGVIDAYIKVKDNNMNVELKSDKKWVKPLDMAKNKLLSMLSDSKYSISIDVNEREKELNIASSRDFFSDGRNSSINVRV